MHEKPDKVSSTYVKRITFIIFFLKIPQDSSGITFFRCCIRIFFYERKKKWYQSRNISVRQLLKFSTQYTKRKNIVKYYETILYIFLFVSSVELNSYFNVFYFYFLTLYFITKPNGNKTKLREVCVANPSYYISAFFSLSLSFSIKYCTKQSGKYYFLPYIIRVI